MAEKPGTTKDKAAAAAKAEPKKRTILTPAERIAKMEADLLAEREKVQAKAKGQHAKALDELSALQARAKELDSKVTAKKAEVDEFHAVAFPSTAVEDEATAAS